MAGWSAMGSCEVRTLLRASHVDVVAPAQPASMANSRDPAENSGINHACTELRGVDVRFPSRGSADAQHAVQRDLVVGDVRQEGRDRVRQAVRGLELQGRAPGTMWRMKEQTDIGHAWIL